MKNNVLKKVLKILGNVLFGIFLVFILFIAITNIRAKSTDNVPNIFGYGYLNVLSDSMDGDKEDSFKIGDLIFVKLVNREEAKNLEEGSIITYRTVIKGEDMTISHRIVEVVDCETYILYKTQGDHPAAEMAALDAIRDDQVIAVYQGKWAGAGSVFAWFSSGFGFFLIVCVPCILFLIFEIINFVKVYIEYKNEKQQVAMAGGPDSIQNKIRMRKAAYDDLVKEGTLTKEQAEAALNEYIKSVSVIETEQTVEETPAAFIEPVEVTTEEVKEEAPVEETPKEVPSNDVQPVAEETPVIEEVKTIEEVEKKTPSTKKSTTKKTTPAGTAKKKTSSTGTKKTTTKKSAE